MNCPFLMQDARQFTDYKSSNYVYEVLKNKYNIPDYAMRNFLQNNGDILSAQFRKDAEMTMACSNPVYIMPQGFLANEV